VKLPRDISGMQLAKLLQKYGYQITRQVGSHIRLTSNFRGPQHHISIPAHSAVKVGTLGKILSDVAAYLEVSRGDLEQELFDQ
jgi:predicted RNA binding protein YcfA (HicA-like mRNA interferase family)